MRRHDRPDTPNIDALPGHRLDDIFPRSLGVELKEICLGRNVGISAAIQPLACFLPDGGIDATPFRNQLCVLQTRLRRSHGRDRHRIPSRDVADLLHQILSCGHYPATQTSHPVELGERAQHNHVLARLHHVHRRGRAAEVDVGLIHHHHRAFWFVLDQIFNVAVRRQRSCRIVRAADIKQSRVGCGRDHRLHVMCVRLRQRNFHDARTGSLASI